MPAQSVFTKVAWQANHCCLICSLRQDCAVLTSRVSRFMCVVPFAGLMPAGGTRTYKRFHQDSAAAHEHMEHVELHRTDTTSLRPAAARASAGFQSAAVQNGCAGAGCQRLLKLAGNRVVLLRCACVLRFVSYVRAITSPFHALERMAVFMKSSRVALKNVCWY